MPKLDKLNPNNGRYMDEGDRVRNIIDMTTGSMTGITSDHRAIHKKEGYHTAGIFTAVANGATVNYAFKTPTLASGKLIHWKFTEMYADGTRVRTDLYEAPTNDPINGTNLAMVNRNRVRPLIDTVMQAFKSSMDIDLTGAIPLEPKLFGNAVGARPFDLEYVLEPDTWYIRTITNQTGAAANINFFEFWYEEDNII